MSQITFSAQDKAAAGSAHNGAASLSRCWHTIRHLRAVQLYGRAWFHTVRPPIDLSSPPSTRDRAGPWQTPPARQPVLVGPDRFDLLNAAGSLEHDGWDNPERPKLWRYHQHYFDDLVAENAEARKSWHRALIDDWMANNPPGVGTGWEPYPSSRRIVNWIKWALAGNALSEPARHSLVIQVRWLKRRMEWHLLGNHLLTNAKALVFAGCFFEGPDADAWRQTGADIIEAQLPEQILADGGHCERSPMYHALVLEDLLDLANVLTAFGHATHPLVLAIRHHIPLMLRWLDAMCHPDGEIAFFNDAAFGMAPAPAGLHCYAKALSVPAPELQLSPCLHLDPSGYVRLQAGDGAVIADVAPVGPDHLPGHAHADTLSFEFSLGKQRVVVNGGTSIYGTGPERHRQRSTAAHSTVEIDSANSSDVWAGFRVAQRARVHDIGMAQEGSALHLSAWHDGYRHRPGRPAHHRHCTLEPGRLTIQDTIDGAFGHAVARFHLHPKASLEAQSANRGAIRLACGRTMFWRTDSAVLAAPSVWHPEFGRTIETKQLVLPFSGPSRRIVFEWEGAECTSSS